MYRIIDESGTSYNLYNYESESKFEAMIIENSEYIFGKDGIYFDIKKLIGKPKKGQLYQMGIILI